jgi:hypothetical protein
MAVRLSALRTGRTLLSWNIIILMFLVLISQERKRWRAVVNSVLNLRVPWNAGGTDFCYRLSKPQGLVRPEGFGLKLNFFWRSQLENLWKIEVLICALISVQPWRIKSKYFKGAGIETLSKLLSSVKIIIYESIIWDTARCLRQACLLYSAVITLALIFATTRQAAVI